MRCLFCKCPSDDATSVEHIVPESLGNRRHILPRGAICDRCNNYFSREVEGPLLSHPSMRNSRAWYQEPTKKGKLPSLLGVHLGSDIEVNLRVADDGDLKIGPYGINAERGADRDRLFRSVAADEPYGGPGFGFVLGTDPPEREMSRFLAKWLSRCCGYVFRRTLHRSKCSLTLSTTTAFAFGRAAEITLIVGRSINAGFTPKRLLCGTPRPVLGSRSDSLAICSLPNDLKLFSRFASSASNTLSMSAARQLRGTNSGLQKTISRAR
jgi:HNH endonuclease